jgi:regulator of sigma E protease
VPATGGWDAFFDALPEQPVLSYKVLRNGAETEVEGPHIFPPLVEGVAPNSAAEDVGLAEGDVILSVDGTAISTFAELREKAGASDGKPMRLGVWRDGQTTDFTLVPKRMDLPLDGGQFETRWLIGVTGGLLFSPETETPGLWQAAKYGGAQTWRIVESSISGLWHMAKGAISSCNLRGPIGIAQTSGDAASQGLSSFIWFIAVLSTAVGLLNLFPVPILDGGHLVFHAYEAVTGRAPGDRVLRVLLSIGLVLLVALMAFALTNDIRCCVVRAVVGGAPPTPLASPPGMAQEWHPKATLAPQSGGNNWSYKPINGPAPCRHLHKVTADFRFWSI